MQDKPHKSGPDALQALRSLDPEVRRHLIGLFEQHTEGLIILIFQIAFAFYLLLKFPRAFEDSPIALSVALALYIPFSVFWVVRSINAISREVYGSFTKGEFRAGRAYARYCEGGWFLRTIAGLLLATIGLALVARLA